MKITIEVEDVSQKDFELNHVGIGVYRDKDVVVSIAAPDGSPIIQVGDKSYRVDMKKILISVGALDEQMHELDT